MKNIFEPATGFNFKPAEFVPFKEIGRAHV